MKIVSFYHTTMYSALMSRDPDKIKDQIPIKGMQMTSIARLVANMPVEESKQSPLYCLINQMSDWFKKIDELDIFIEPEQYAQLIDEGQLLIGNMLNFLDFYDSTVILHLRRLK